MDPWRPIPRRNTWRARLAVLQCPTIVALIAEFANSDERIVCQLAALEWNTTQRLWQCICDCNRLWRTADDVVIEQLRQQIWADEVADEQDLLDGIDGSGCVCNAVRRRVLRDAR